MRGVSFPHPPRMRHDGMQEECSDEENEQSLIKFMTENSEVIPESSPAQKKKKVQPGGPLSTGDLQRVNNMLLNMEKASAKMTRELDSAKMENALAAGVIGPGVITALVDVKRKCNVAAAELKTYKENNKEVDTSKVLEDAKKLVTDARKEVTILKKIVNMKCPATQAADEAV